MIEVGQTTGGTHTSYSAIYGEAPGTGEVTRTLVWSASDQTGSIAGALATE